MQACSRINPRRDEVRVFDHEDDGALRGAGAVGDALGHDEAVARGQFHGAVFEVNEERAFDDIEEFFVVVLVSVVFALDDAETDDGVVDPAAAEQMVWLCLRSVQAATKVDTPTSLSGANLMSRRVA